MQRKSLGMAASAAFAIAAMTGIAATPGAATEQLEAKTDEARAAAQTSGTIPGASTQRSADALPWGRWWNRPAARRRWPGRGWSVKVGQRMAARRRNVLRNRRAHR